MYRSLILFKIIFSLTLVLPMGAAAQEDCADKSIVGAQGCMATRPVHVYNSAFNGRDVNGENVTTSNDANSVTIPLGYYQDKTLTWASENLNAANIKEGTTLFGIAGILNTSAHPTCPLDGPAHTASCNAPAASFAYTQESGGRALDCTVEDTNKITGPCYAPATGYTVRTELTPSACSTSGQVTKTCMVNNGAYWYNSRYGGRSLDCINGTNATKCWLGVEQATAAVANVCNENATNNGYNSGPCKTSATNRYVYSSDKGGRAADCADNDTGYCWITTGTKSGTASNMTAANIKNGKVIFGVTGTYTGTPFSWGSGAHRVKSGTASPNRITYTQETGYSTATQLPTDYNPIPKIASSTDGFNQPAVVTPVDRTGWGQTQCGTTGTVGARIADCASVPDLQTGTGTTWVGERYGNAGQTTWDLVSRTWSNTHGRAFEVWRDSATGLLWSSQVHTSLNWCKASGNSNSQNVRSDLQDSDPSNICNNSLNQSVGANNAVSACYEGTGFTASALYMMPEGKGGLNTGNAASNGKVAWRLPTIYDYILANHHGLRFVLPDTAGSGQEWTATTFSRDRSKAWTFDSTTGIRETKERQTVASVRCVGR